MTNSILSADVDGHGKLMVQLWHWGVDGILSVAKVHVLKTIVDEGIATPRFCFHQVKVFSIV